ncbi:hypothetical protein NDU88_004784 [Pleurodeles waltl]|uniref:Uncharacterized protein n=1 Tax=Pleurodeles waltl TaxID=8319 RepID=A0AAV7UJ41_PLEWA|nr:hypothetical protein NDU88_004784 [Pleurodeles waltl]
MQTSRTSKNTMVALDTGRSSLRADSRAEETATAVVRATHGERPAEEWHSSENTEQSQDASPRRVGKPLVASVMKRNVEYPNEC